MFLQICGGLGFFVVGGGVGLVGWLFFFWHEISKDYSKTASALCASSNRFLAGLTYSPTYHTDRFLNNLFCTHSEQILEIRGEKFQFYLRIVKFYSSVSVMCILPYQ